MDSFELPSDIFDPSELHKKGREPLQPSDPERLDLDDIEDVRQPVQPSLFDEDERRPDPAAVEEPEPAKTRTRRQPRAATNRRSARTVTAATPAPETEIPRQREERRAEQPRNFATAASATHQSGESVMEPLWPTMKDFFSDGRLSIFFGVVLILFAAYLLLASISYISNISADQSLLVNTTADALRNRASSVENTTGWFGAFLSHFMIYRWLGVGAFVLIFYLAALGLSLVKLCRFKFWSLTFKSLVSAVALSLIVGLATYYSATPEFWGGEHGYYINSLLIENASLWGAIAVSTLMATALILIFLKPVSDICRFIGGGFGKMRQAMERRHNEAVAAAHRTAVREQAERREARRHEAPAPAPAPAARRQEVRREEIQDEPVVKREAEDIPVVNNTIDLSNKEAEEEVVDLPKPAPKPQSLDEKYAPTGPIVLTDITPLQPSEPEEMPEEEAPIALETVIEEAPVEEKKATEESPAPAKEALPALTLGLTLATDSDSVDLSNPEDADEEEERDDEELQPLAQTDVTMTTIEASPIEKAESPETPEPEKPAAAADDSNLYDPRADLAQYRFPTLDLLMDREMPGTVIDEEEQEANKSRIINILRSYGVEIASITATIGPTITLYEIVPAPGVRIAKIKRLGDDVALNLSAMGIRIIAPIPGKGTIGMEVPNKNPQIVSMRSILSSKAYCESKAQLPMALGSTISNEVYVADLAKMPHLLVAGATGMGKSVGLNTIIASLLYRKHPSELKFVLVDPKMVEFSLYKCIERHYLAKIPDDDEKAIITDPLKVVATLNSLCIEMDNRYELLSEAGMRGIKEYNEKFISRRLNPLKGHRFLPYIVVVIDEFADLILTAGKEVETPISRIAAKARAVGIHMILATQRPSVNVITGVIKANFPGRMAFRVTQRNDSQTILDRLGAEQLIGRGDMLISRDGIIDRVQCAFIDTPEVEAICNHIASQQGYPTAYELPEVATGSGDGSGSQSGALGDRDPLFAEAGREVIAQGVGSTSSLQRKFNIGYPRAGKIMDQLEAAGVVGPTQGGKPRAVNMDMYSFERYLESTD